MANVVLISTYEMGRQPFGIASPAAWLRQEGAAVTVQDLSVSHFDPESVRRADVVAFHVPMHTATRLAEPVLEQVQRLNPKAHVCFYGLYAPLNDDHLRRLGVDSILGGEFEHGLVALYRELFNVGDLVATVDEPRFIVPDRSGLPRLGEYARLEVSGQSMVTGYTEASRGCKHRCRHCPIVPVYDGRFVVVPADVVLEDIERQVAAGAEHITFGDPDFFNGPAHAMRIVERLHAAYPGLTYDATIKVEHLRARSDLIPALKETGCVLVTSAIESFDDVILERLDKQHTRGDIEFALKTLRDADLPLNATFVAFTPWTSMAGYLDFLQTIVDLGLVGNVAPIQYAIRLLIVAGSRLLDLSDVAEAVEAFDESALVHPWQHDDPAVDELQRTLLSLVDREQTAGSSKRQIFAEVWHAAHAAAHGEPIPLPDVGDLATIPFFTEPWFC